ncbi:integration host factor subunit alpha [Buchnera aphidicola]|uniref:Integration host factor subunit alpha n=1 Tax=Buchnera aphidicola subsp. Uroleucon sonchi TaxID=118118 RepID=A0A6C1FB28_BUCUN|nr:integration host factor subunit alpha [Buchnera aphidicola]QIE01877.1 integration host factor subunit alpha [Buchnera aphidicola (Uroleucon sonchi)]
MVLTKAEIVEHLFEKFHLTKRDSKILVEFFFEEIRKSLEKGEDVKLSGFGNFYVKNKNSRPGRNPKTGEDFLIKARQVVTFKAGRKLKDKIDNFLIKKI